MRVLVAYASRHGSTQGIAERIGAVLEDRGLDVDVRLAAPQLSVDGYDAFVVGSAAYIGRWLKPARQFVSRHLQVMAMHPVWLFSSGPIGTEMVDAKGRDVLKASEPDEFREFAASLQPRDMRIFFGAYDPQAQPVGFAERIGSVFTKIPAIQKAMPSGDFRDWAAIDAWGEAIALDLGCADGIVRASA